MSQARSGLKAEVTHANVNAHDASSGQLNDGFVAKVVHTDGTIDYIDARAVGGDVTEMPAGYYWSSSFIGTVAV
jgi:hypothetical protein